MKPASEAAARISASKLVAIVRLPSLAASETAAQALVAAGVTVLEFSLASEIALRAIGTCSRQYGDEILVGAGTVLDYDQADAAVQAGASFVIAPNTDPTLIEWALRQNVLYIPGCFTPTELVAARQAGATLLKLFPAGRLGPDYIRDLLAPMPDLALLPTGGVMLANAPAFLRAGAVAVAVGSNLVSADTATRPARLEAEARKFVAAVRAELG
jgi:2-dehydro-3-deoxyphosphogluconate aldolase / (4S)-4-hydroxy-2-oxoglutarate aldolase